MKPPKPIKKKKKPVECRCNGKFTFSKTPTGTKRTCVTCGRSVTEVGNGIGGGNLKPVTNVNGVWRTVTPVI